MDEPTDAPSTKVEHGLEQGLSSEEAKQQLKKYGYNEVPEKKASSLAKFLMKFWGLTPWMLEITIVLEGLLGKYLEMAIIACLLIFNAITGFIQEQRATAAVDLLREKLTVRARVKRNGNWESIPSRELVPDDIIRLRAGDFVPADASIIEGHTDVDQSSLTGESLIVEKKEKDALYSGSMIVRGEATAGVTSTGTKTYFGRTVELVQIARPKLHMEEVISTVTKWLLGIVVIMLSVGIALSVMKGIDLTDVIPLASILLVSAIPVALPTMFTISMALSSLELSKKGALLTRLDAVEDAASMNVACVDKTGTITMNRLFVMDAVPAAGYDREDVVLLGALASQEANEDPIDLAFLWAAKEMHVSSVGYTQRDFTPFDPTKRRTEAVIEKDGKEFLVLKGAFSTIASMCKDQEQAQQLSEAVESFSIRGYRTIAVAMGKTEKEIVLVGIAALYDKPRADSPGLIRELKDLGVSVKMLTGDALPIAKEIAKQIGLSENIVRASDVRKGRDVQDTGVEGFAEVYPEDKYSIVKSFQEGGNVVGMTGDGVNDAPALRQAEVGIAVSNATDIAKKSSSVVLTVEGLEGIVELVKIGRMTYQRIATWTVNKIIRTFKRVVFIVLAFIVTGKYVVSTFNMVLLLFLSDYVTLSISTDRVRYSQKPDTWNVTGMVKLGGLLGILLVIESMLMLYLGFWLFGLYDDIERLHTFVFDFLVFSGYFILLTVRERRHFWESRPSDPLIISILVNSVLVCLISILGLPGLSPIPPIELVTVLIYTFVTCLMFNDFVKVFLARRLGAVF